LAARPALRRHGGFLINARSSNNEQTFRAIARDNDLALLTALQDRLKGVVEAKVAPGLVLAVTSNAGSLQHRLDVFVKCQILCIGGGRQLADINPADVPLIMLLRGRRQAGERESKNEKCGATLHISSANAERASLRLQEPNWIDIPARWSDGARMNRLIE
jgi:hypothetical protein